MSCSYKQQGICILVEDKIGVLVLLYCYHKSGLVLSTPSSQFKGNSCVVSSFLLKQVCTLDITVFYVVMFFEEWY